MFAKKTLWAMAIVCGLGMLFTPTYGLVAGSTAQLPSNGAARLVQELASRTAQALASPKALEPVHRREMLRELVHKGFNLELTSQFVLGKHWRSANEPQRAEFVDLFTENLLNSYTHYLTSFRAESLRIVASNHVGEGDTLVETNVEGENGPAAPVWRVRAADGQYKIIDVSVDGMSLALTQRREFASVVNSIGLEGLLKLLRQKLADQTNTTDLPSRLRTHATFLGSILTSPNTSRLDLVVPGR